MRFSEMRFTDFAEDEAEKILVLKPDWKQESRYP
jgi:hypothetical protein